MNTNPSSDKLMALLSKGGVMYFTIERPERVYSGLVVLSGVQNNFRNRAVYMKEYKCSE